MAGVGPATPRRSIRPQNEQVGAAIGTRFSHLIGDIRVDASLSRAFGRKESERGISTPDLASGVRSQLGSAAGTNIAEVGFLLVLIAGVWLVAAEIPTLGLYRVRTIVAGAALALAGVLLIIATHWGHFGELSKTDSC